MKYMDLEIFKIKGQKKNMLFIYQLEESWINIRKKIKKKSILGIMESYYIIIKVLIYEGDLLILNL